MLSIDLRGKRALVAGIADDQGLGFAIARALCEAGATVCAGTWPPALGIFKTMLERGKFADSLALPDGRAMSFERIDPFDADYDTTETMLRHNFPGEIGARVGFTFRGKILVADEICLGNVIYLF